jgi:signal transduction histidine kinase
MRRRLVVVALATTSMVAIAFLLPLGALVRSVAHDQALTDAERDGRRVADALTIGATAEQLRAVTTDVTARRPGEVAEVFFADGTSLAQRPPDADVERARARAESFDTAAAGGAQVLIPVVGTRGTDVVRVFVSRGLLTKNVWRSWLILIAVAVALVALAVLVADRLAASIVKPVRALAGATGRLADGQTDTRVEPSGPPEVVEAGVAVNTLADRIDGLVAAERELIADLSHRLRTPLAALRLDAEAIDDPDVAARVSRDVAALEGAVDVLISEARRPRDAVPASADLAGVVRERASFWAALAEDQGRPWHLDVPVDSIDVAVRPAELEAAVDALLDNVFAHTPDGAAATVAVSALGTMACVLVDDDGPGFPDERVLDRGVSGTASSGLGLDIVRRTVTGAGGTVQIINRTGGGGRVQLLLPVAERC